MKKKTTAADLRGDIAKANVRVYKVAALVDLHPSRLSEILHGHVPLSVDLAQRIREAVVVAASPPVGNSARSEQEKWLKP